MWINDCLVYDLDCVQRTFSIVCVSFNMDLMLFLSSDVVSSMLSFSSSSEFSYACMQSIQ